MAGEEQLQRHSAGVDTNTVAGSFSTYRRMVVYVEYHDTVILKREVPLGFGLKPRSSRLMVMEINGDHFPVMKELGAQNFGEVF